MSQRSNLDAVGTTGAKASVATTQAYTPVSDGQLTDLRDRLSSLEQQLRSERSVHAQEIKRLSDQVVFLQDGGVPAPRRLEWTAREALHRVILEFESVAVGGAASDLRKTVDDVASRLSPEGRAEFRGFVSRLRSAAEAADQEASVHL